MKDVPLVLVHGYPFDRTMWFSTIAAFGANGKVMAPDMPGFGKAELPSGVKPSLDVMAEHLADLLTANGHERAVIAGMSMGGYIALAFAARFKQRLAGLGLISTQAAADTPEARQARKETIKKIKAEGPSVAVEPLLPKLFTTERLKSTELAAYPTQAASSAGVDGLCWALQAMADRPDRTDVLKELTVPVMIVHGSEDKIVPSAKARQLAEICREPIFLELRGVAHASPLEAPDGVAAGLIRLMKRVREKGADAVEPAGLA